MSSGIEQLFQNVDEQDLKQRIVEELLNTEQNLETKTELGKPMLWSCLSVVKDFVNNQRFKKSTDILEGFINTSFKFLISNKREGRKEYIEALKSLSRMVEDEHKNNMLNPKIGG